ncbi:MAG: HAD family hydrolase [Deltaproteobacteria bacterium]
MKNIAVFLDRDGTINEDKGYIGRPEDVVLIDGVSSAIRTLNRGGIKAIVVTNQSGVGRGFFGEPDLQRVNERLRELLGKDGAFVDGVYFCPHRPDAFCACRKPGPLLAETASAEHAIDKASSYVVGDKEADIGLARNIGAKAVLVLTGHGREELNKTGISPDFVARDVLQAIDWIMQDIGRDKDAAAGIRAVK